MQSIAINQGSVLQRFVFSSLGSVNKYPSQYSKRALDVRYEDMQSIIGYYQQAALFMNKPRTLPHKTVECDNLAHLHKNILEKIVQLQRINRESKDKQEQHFLKTFMNVLQKMGNDLILAQQAYRSIDIEVKRDQYIVELATQLDFFKDECFTLNREIKKIKSELHSMKLDKQMLKNEAKSVGIAYEKKIGECKQLKEINSQLKRQIREYIKEKNSRVVTLANNERDAQIEQLVSQRESSNLIDNKLGKIRWMKTQELTHRIKIGKSEPTRRMKIGQSADLPKPTTQQTAFPASPKKPQKAEIKYRVTNHSSQHRMSQRNDTQQLYLTLKSQA